MQLISKNHFILYPAILSITFIVCCFNVPHFEITALDDTLMIAEQLPKYKDPLFFFEIFKDDVFLNTGGSYYRPMQQVWLMISANIFSYDTFGYKGFFYSTLLCFWGVILLFYQMLIKLKLNPNTAFFTSLFVLIHPTLVPAWAWVPGMVDSQLAIYTLMAIHSLHIKSKFRIVFNLFWFMLALFTKESAIFLPIITLFYDTVIIQQKTIQLKTLFSIRKLTKFQYTWANQNTTLTLGYTLIVIGYFVLRKQALTDSDVNGLLVLNRLGWSPFHFIYLMGSWLFPVDLAAFRGFSILESFLYLPGLVMLIYLFLKSPISQSRKALFIIWVVCFYLPTSIADKINFHRNLTPILGIAFLVPPDLYNIILTKHKKTLIFSLSALAILTLDFKQNFSTQHRFWQSALDKSPKDPVALSGKAVALYNEKKYEEAYVYFRKSCQIDSTNITSVLGMAAIKQINKEFEACDSLINLALRRNDDKQEITSYMGEIYLDRGNPTAALNAFERARSYYETNGYLEHKIDSLKKVLDQH